MVSLNFHKALTTPQQPKIILSCKNSNVKKPIWLNDGDIALMQSYADKWKIIRYSPERDQSAELYKPGAGNIIDYVYSRSDDIFAVSRFHSDGKQYIELVEPSGKLMSSHPIQRPEEIAEYRPLYPNFDPLNRQLVFSTGRQLFSLSYQGKVAKIDLPFSDRMALPEFHPNGKRMLMIKGPYDSDIVKVPRESETQTTPQEIENYSSFERTNLGEDYSLFQPGGNLIAFWSERSGEQQVWVSNGTNSKKLTNFPMDTYINGIDWSADGESVLVNGNGILHRVTLDSRQEVYSLMHPVIFLYQWDSRNDTALLLLRINGQPKAVEYNLLNNSYRELSDTPVLWAQKSDSGEVIVKDYFGQYWRPGAVEPKRIEALANQTSKSKSFLIVGDVIYSVNKKSQIWAYDLLQNKFNILAQLNSNVDSLNDVNDKEYLITIQAAAKKEVVELSVAQ
ncbi:hypothetical protein [Aliikangiella marina]|uniref:hypothetical protein n=1 Tax=Aliikangiella marina TaxID=1712262 RepID=UPI001AEE0FE4|nr:hypothetical protein [Aliikangiella marina]